jgi:tRNA pseudouridine38-40 synthase
MRLRLTIAYDGSGFRGWARQPGERTIEGELRDALGRIYRSVGELAVAGRTDAGVHALANVVSVEVEGGARVDLAAEALNTTLPGDIAVVAAEAAAQDFHARFSARSRSYRYRVWTRRERSPFEVRRSLWHPGAIDVERLAAAAESVVGEHDFRAFTPTETQHRTFVRVVADARWHVRGDALELEITADAFLRHMVRTLVGTMLERSPEELADLLRGAHRSAAGSTAPPWGLYLTGVGYR